MNYIIGFQTSPKEASRPLNKLLNPSYFTIFMETFKKFSLSFQKAILVYITQNGFEPKVVIIPDKQAAFEYPIISEISAPKQFLNSSYLNLYFIFSMGYINNVVVVLAIDPEMPCKQFSIEESIL
ncbi:hypothetical protein PPERSA_06955 [Pseudocohnilembus persalinus]|uniref:Uncharacterized protein n=1 Tax=Pseudocohnilembus persalinus TaxID=266149 RepID=A0A0V0QYC7_PSEPJ|nr:hypothetical protein PPERSA_06955 [Pseudocohnilembus persalinus]|eukprot:KRX07340.1 hypothetical protein PPERSA_06955 [Pseudocohnilembus persalinus]